MTTTSTAPAPTRQGSVRLGNARVSPAEALDLLRAGLSCPLSITSVTSRGPVTKTYSLDICRVGGVAQCYRLISDDEPGLMYDLPPGFESCDCADATYRGCTCKHMRAMKALVTRYPELG